LRKVKNAIKDRCVSNLAVADFIIKNKIMTERELFATAKSQYNDGDHKLASFVIRKTKKQLN